MRMFETRSIHISAIFAAIVLSAAVIAGNVRADDDTLRDLGATAAPGEIPKWDGEKWRNAHDNGIVSVTTGPGLTGGGTNVSVSLSVDFDGTGTSNQVARADHYHPTLNSTRPPVGAVIAWLKSYPNTPALPHGWVECNGQTLNDPDSVYNGQTIPNLNGQNRFLRGATTSGSTGGSETHSHGGTKRGSGYSTVAANTTQNHLPPYMNVVWIMRVK
jgi:hypothetical protein